LLMMKPRKDRNEDRCSCGGQVFSDASIGCCFTDSRSKALGDKFHWHIADDAL
jgi:hypothetical protein